MDKHPALPQDLWDQTPPEVRAYIETLEGQVQTLTSMIHTLQEQAKTPTAKFLKHDRHHQITGTATLDLEQMRLIAFDLHWYAHERTIIERDGTDR